MSQSHTLLSISYQRVLKDLQDMALNRRTTGISEFKVSWVSREGLKLVVPVSFRVICKSSTYFNAFFECFFRIYPGFPFKAPELIVKNQVFHPNVNFETGIVRIKILEPGIWTQDMSLNDVILAFEETFVLPDFEVVPDHQVNVEMKDLYLRAFDQFCDIVKGSLDGGSFGGVHRFERFYGGFYVRKRSAKVVLENTKRSRYAEGYECCLMRVS